MASEIAAEAAKRTEEQYGKKKRTQSKATTAENAYCQMGWIGTLEVNRDTCLE